MIELFALIQNPLLLPLPACGEGGGGVGLIPQLCNAVTPAASPLALAAHSEAATPATVILTQVATYK
jgi:hypothetical protein